ncbi:MULTISPECIES: GNAT family N-acetyltransferase [unclassified Moraxella]|uniref:GNAT family N-acetyltransferase n=1 Tax=unclassified Moraxella TaxID=2685852 RepID=UPI003AF4A1F1
MPNTLDFTLKQFSELALTEFYAIAHLREAVFVVEQHCPYQELDGIDPQCYHLQGFVNGELAVYARIIPPTVHPTGKPAIGRVLTAKDYRGHQFGRNLMQQAIDFCHANYPRQPIFISAQVYLLEFYQSLGFVTQGEPYLEDDILHIDMLLI